MRADIKTRFKKGHKPLKGVEKGWFKKGVSINVEEKHPHWKGKKASYSSIHKWVRRKKGKPPKCIDCGVVKDKLDWSNVSHKYLRDLNDYVGRCRSCHRKYDKKKSILNT